MAELHTQKGFLEAQGAPLYYEVAGVEQGYALVLIHAGIADSRMWDEQFGVFAERYRVVRMDLRGYGRSTVPAGAFANHEDIAAVMDFLGMEKAHVVGISFGGKVALDFALTHPERVTALVLGAPSVGGRKAPQEVRQFVEEENELVERGELAAATELNMRMWVDGPRRKVEEVNPEVRRRLYEMQLHAFGVPVPEGAEEIEVEPPAVARLSEIRVPTLLLVGEYDIEDKHKVVEELAGGIAGAREAVIAGAAHIANMEQPGVFNRLVLDFLERVG